MRLREFADRLKEMFFWFADEADQSLGGKGKAFGVYRISESSSNFGKE